MTGSSQGLLVFLRALEVQAEIGLHGHERGRSQPLVVDVEVELEPRTVAGIADTLNYERLARHARALAAAGHIDLVESYAQRLAELCLGEPQARRVRVRVEKPEAIPGAAAAGVEVRLSR